MQTMTGACVKLNAHARNKNEAVRLAGQLLVNAGTMNTHPPKPVTNRIIETDDGSAMRAATLEANLF